MRPRKAALACAAVSLMMAGCAAPLTPGTSVEADVVSVFGAPKEVWPQPDGGKVLVYPPGPLGRESWHVTLDSRGTVRSVEQRLTRERLTQVRPGMSKAEVRRDIGTPSEVMSFPRRQEEVWSWRFIDGAENRWQFSATFAADGRVSATSFLKETTTPGARRPRSTRSSDG